MTDWGVKIWSLEAERRLREKLANSKDPEEIETLTIMLQESDRRKQQQKNKGKL